LFESKFEKRRREKTEASKNPGPFEILLTGKPF
jgi:hypothetical protein